MNYFTISPILSCLNLNTVSIIHAGHASLLN